jgi:hypothetical protein
MKHLLNNLSEEEKNSIREQHTGGMEVISENFKNMVDKKLGDVPTYLNEQPEKITPEKIKGQKPTLPLTNLPEGKYQVWVSMNGKHPITGNHILRIMVGDQPYEEIYEK